MAGTSRDYTWMVGDVDTRAVGSGGQGSGGVPKGVIPGVCPPPPTRARVYSTSILPRNTTQQGKADRDPPFLGRRSGGRGS